MPLLCKKWHDIVLHGCLLVFYFSHSYICAYLGHCWDSILFNDLLNKLDVRAFNIDNPAFAFEQTLELRRKHVALEVERWRALQRTCDRLRELGRVCSRKHDLTDIGRAMS